MDNLFAAGSASLLSLPLPLSANSSEAPKPLLKSTSLSRLDELQQYLKQCDNQQYIRRYYKMLSSCPSDVLDDYAKQLKNRAVWLATEEQREYKRAKLLNVMGDPLVPAANADAEAFCTKVLEGDEDNRTYPDEECITPHNTKAGGSGGRAAAGGQQAQQQQRAQQEEGSRTPRAAAAASMAAGMPPLFSPLAHVTLTDHHISPLPSTLLPLQPHSGRVAGALEGLLQTQLDSQLEGRP